MTPKPPVKAVVERVARAMWEARCKDARKKDHYLTTALWGAIPEWSQHYRLLARAAIREMRRTK